MGLCTACATGVSNGTPAIGRHMNGDSKRLRRRIARAAAPLRRVAPVAILIMLAAGLAGCDPLEELADIFKTDDSRFLSPFETVRQPKRTPI